MSEFPRQYLLPDPLVHITPFTLHSVEAVLVSTAGIGSAIYPTANLAIFIPFRITRPMTFTNMFCYNGATVSGNIDLGVYSADGTKIVSTGSTAQAGISAIQTITVASTELGAGLFYMAVVMNNITGTLQRKPYVLLQSCNFLGMAQMASAFPLPDTATFATVSNAYLPVIGLTTRSFV